MENRQTLSAALSWEELAKLYKFSTGQSAYLFPMDEVYNYFAGQTDDFKVLEEGTIHQIIQRT